jgi:hypothetical protein
VDVLLLLLAPVMMHSPLLQAIHMPQQQQAQCLPQQLS